ncbi:hypothetical protein [Pseudomonas asiatica]|uniref:hypothetical protein n=1 Tax=Pseudomonas asiatica TaxID=2219225 RepID=UPI0032EDBA55
MAVEMELKWLVMEGAVPLLGAAVLYTALGICTYIVSTAKGTFAFQWSQALDSLGWLYGGAILAMQSGMKGWDVKNVGVLPQACFAVAVVCLLILIAAMMERGKNPSWQPPKLLKALSALLVVIILYAGFETQLTIKGAQQ